MDDAFQAAKKAMKADAEAMEELALQFALSHNQNPNSPETVALRTQLEQEGVCLIFTDGKLTKIEIPF